MTTTFALLRVGPSELGWACLLCLLDLEEEVTMVQGELWTILECPRCREVAEIPPAGVRAAWNEAVARQLGPP